jgi:simple sugar transport system permease protein
VLLASLFFGGLRQGGYLMQLNANIPGDLVYIIQALVLFCIAAEFLPAIQRALPAWMSFSRRPALATGIKGPTVIDLPREGAASSNGEPVPVEGDAAATDSATVERHSERVEED